MNSNFIREKVRTFPISTHGQRRSHLVCASSKIAFLSVGFFFLCFTSTAIPQDLAEHDALEKRIEALVAKVRGQAKLSYEEVREYASELKKLDEDIDDYLSRLSRKTNKEQDLLKLDGTKVNMIDKRAKEWDDFPWPLMNASPNNQYKEWLAKESIRGQRILVKNSDSAPWRWRILVAKNNRSESTMVAWLKEQAKGMKSDEWAKAYPGADQIKAEKEGKLPDWAIHHVVPLYTGDANGGQDQPSNYVLLKKSDHIAVHSSSGATFQKWGPPRIYVTRGHEFEEIDDMGDD